MKIDIICVGKIKEEFTRAAIAEYTKRLGRYADISIIEVADEPAPENASPAIEDKIRQKEGERIARHIAPDAFVFALEIKGRELSSEELAGKIEDLGVMGKSHLQFIIGGSIGLAKEVSDLADFKLSFSKMTFPHQLMRVILLEQIYRGMRIINHEPYHK